MLGKAIGFVGTSLLLAGVKLLLLYFLLSEPNHPLFFENLCHKLNTNVKLSVKPVSSISPNSMTQRLEFLYSFI